MAIDQSNLIKLIQSEGLLTEEDLNASLKAANYIVTFFSLIQSENLDNSTIYR